MTTKIVVAGSREITSYSKVEDAILSESPYDSSPKQWDCEIISGGANGVDSLAIRFARNYNLPYREFDPKRPEETETEFSFNQYLNQSFILRNEEMAEESDLLIAIWDGQSNGTRNMIEQMLDKGKPVKVVIEN